MESKLQKTGIKFGYIVKVSNQKKKKVGSHNNDTWRQSQNKSFEKTNQSPTVTMSTKPKNHNLKREAEAIPNSKTRKAMPEDNKMEGL